MCDEYQGRETPFNREGIGGDGRQGESEKPDAEAEKGHCAEGGGGEVGEDQSVALTHADGSDHRSYSEVGPSD
jgi:hypothetical protein